MIGINTIIKKPLFFWLSLFSFADNCAHFRNPHNTKSTLAENSDSTLAQNDRGVGQDFLALQPTEYEAWAPLESAQFQWQPFLLPIKTQLVLTDSNFLIGFRNLSGVPLQSFPENGRCIFFPKKYNSQHTPQRNLTFHAEGIMENSSLGRIFFLHSQFSTTPVGFGFFDERGESRCASNQDFSSTSEGLGLSRSEHDVNNKLNSIGIPLRKRFLIEIIPGSPSLILPGDILRVGRMSEKSITPELQLKMPFVYSIDEDLFKKTEALSENFGINEYLKTSILVGNSSFSISLAAGKYRIVIIKKDGLKFCSFSLDEDKKNQSKIACPETKTAEISSNPGTNLDSESPESIQELTVDATVFPERLISTNIFKKFLIQHGMQLLLKTKVKKLADSSIENNEFNFFAIESSNSISDSPFALKNQRLLTGSSRQNPEAWMQKHLEKSEQSGFLLGGTSETALAHGVVPLLTKTVFRSGKKNDIPLEKNNAYITNGTKIEWLEPDADTSEQPLRMPSQQHFRARITVPVAHPTEFITLFANSKVFKRWVLNRTDLSSPFTFLIDEKIEEKSDFELSILAWGNHFLPEFLTGIQGLLPIAVSRRICIDVNENGQCDSHK